MTIEIRSIRDAELGAYIGAVSTGFLERIAVDERAEAVRPYWDLARAWAALDAGRVVGTARTWPTELTVPGLHRIKASALTAVTVQPTHRRRGLLRGMLAAEHAAARERGEIASILYASEYPIYGRFGYGTAIQMTGWQVDLRGTVVSDTAGGHAGTVELLPIDASGVETVKTVYEAWRQLQTGEIWRRPIMWDNDFGLAVGAWGDQWKGFLAVHRDDDGTVDGYARYRADAKWEQRQPRSTMVVDELHGLTPDAGIALWRFLSNVDLVTTLRAERRSPADRLPWLLTNARAAEMFDTGDGVWVRLNDVPAALEARAYERSGSIVIEAIDPKVVDGDGATARVRVALDASPDGARATLTEREPDLTLDRAALGAAYLGGTRLRDAVLVRGCDEHRAGALAELDALLATLDVPWCSTFF